MSEHDRARPGQGRVLADYRVWAGAGFDRGYEPGHRRFVRRDQPAEDLDLWLRLGDSARLANLADWKADEPAA